MSFTVRFTVWGFILAMENSAMHEDQKRTVPGFISLTAASAGRLGGILSKIKS
ncbi:hypothetical protein CYPRO_0416 [Cyclonatronum proteinivorum]|uniref:Uncharacterized protein n=1 Tax=Cyclonatronum proteinivorum TaxID=1457365 RepID=A0A345UGV2_9BACT|nr:hypothetical protein CYPRO_0416 [Cyclonatronum proteinivorum]